MGTYGRSDIISKSYELAKSVYASFNIDTDKVLNELKSIPISMHCWQGDDVTGFEPGIDGLSGGGIMATGNCPGKARNGDELRQDLDTAMRLIPGKHRVNLHAIYAETVGKSVDRDELKVEYFNKWIAWAKSRNICLDFNPSFFSHEKAAEGYTLSSTNEKVREFWVRHAMKCREIAAAIGKELGAPCINNIWVPDGSKDLPADRMEHRKLLQQSLDEIFSVKYDRSYLIDTVESKLFGIGSESYVVGSHEFYMGYAMKNNITLCLDAGHFHPTEGISDKISSILSFSPELLLHVSRGVRWDSDHVVIMNDDLLSIAQEIKRCNAYDRVHIALDYFDASINRITAWVTGMRAAQKAMLISLLEPTHLLRAAETEGDNGTRLALIEVFETLPFGTVWDKFCLDNSVPAGIDWIEQVKKYEAEVLMKRS